MMNLVVVEGLAPLEVELASLEVGLVFVALVGSVFVAGELVFG